MAAVWLKVRVDVTPVDPDGALDELTVTAAVQEAVASALAKAEESGFEHDESDRLSLAVDYVEAFDFDATC